MERADPHPPSIAISFVAQQWKVLEPNSDVGVHIAAIATLLDSIVVRMKRSNAPPEEQALSNIERAQLIAILETALAVLRSPAVEKGLLDKAREGLSQAAKKAAEKQVEQGVGNAAGQAYRMLGDLLKSIFS